MTEATVRLRLTIDVDLTVPAASYDGKDPALMEMAAIGSMGLSKYLNAVSPDTAVVGFAVSKP